MSSSGMIWVAWRKLSLAGGPKNGPTASRMGVESAARAGVARLARIKVRSAGKRSCRKKWQRVGVVIGCLAALRVGGKLSDTGQFGGQAGGQFRCRVLQRRFGGALLGNIDVLGTFLIPTNLLAVLPV